MNTINTTSVLIILEIIKKREWGVGSGEWGTGSGEWGVGNGEWGSLFVI
jgi:hypothetical protein